MPLARQVDIKKTRYTKKRLFFVVVFLCAGQDTFRDIKSYET